MREIRRALVEDAQADRMRGNGRIMGVEQMDRTILDRSRERRVRRMIRGALAALIVLLVLWLGAAYGVAPALWRHHEHGPAFAGTPVRAVTADGIPGDPLNVGLVGTRVEIVAALVRAGWRPADAVTFRSSVGIVASVALHRPDPNAPVSPLYVFGRKQDLAFEKPVGTSAKQRHHVRLWAVDHADSATRGPWIGGATFDRGVGLSRYTEQVTHHIAPDVDAERDTLIANLRAAGALSEIYDVSGMGPTVAGRNGGGDRFFTDGEMTVGVLRLVAGDGSSPATDPPIERDSPLQVRWKNAAWRPLRPLLR